MANSFLAAYKKSRDSGVTIFDRRRNLQRQGRLRRNSDDLPPLKKHASMPTPGTSFSNTEGSTRRAGPSQPSLQKHSSHPPMAQNKHRRALQEDNPREANASYDSTETPRASHTPAMRLGPPLSCNFCWNTVDECGRILRRKTQYHCPECRTNLCIVPCFHEYHDGTAAEEHASAR